MSAFCNGLAISFLFAGLGTAAVGFASHLPRAATAASALLLLASIACGVLSIVEHLRGKR